MEIKRCMNCMEELSENNGICPACGTDNQTIEQPNYALQCGAMLHGRYFVGKVLGQGGFGITYIGLDLLFNVKVAIKEYFPMGMVTRDSGGSSKILWNTSQASQTQRQGGYDSFLKEARKMAKIDQIPSIVRVRDLFLENETAYIVMDYVEGVTLKQKLQQDGPISFSNCVALLRPMLEDLAKVHREGMIHRDISPDNIMIQPDGSVRLLDLGAAKDMTAVQGVSSQVVAKKGFSPLEQYKSKGEVGPWTDVYALCATIYYCITGKLLPDAFDRIEEDEEIHFPDSLKEPLSEETKDALRAGLEVRVKKRTQSVEELLRQLDAEKTGEECKAEGVIVSEQEGGGRQKTGNAEEGNYKAEGAEGERQKQKEDSAPKQEEGEKQDGVEEGGDKAEEVEGEGQKQEAIADSEQDERIEKVSTDKAGVLSKLSKVKKGVWTAVAVCLVLVVGALIKVVSEPKELPVMMEDADIEISDSPEDMGNYTVLGSKLKRNQIRTITFQDNLKNQPEDAWDVSEKQDGTVMAWASPTRNDMYELYIGGKGGVQAPQSCEKLFSGYTDVEKINFNGCFDTSQVTGMRAMFFECIQLRDLDLSSFDTSQITDMRGMFGGCLNLENLNLSSFDTSQVADMELMFWACPSLKQLDLSSFDTGQVMSMNCMFFCCYKLSDLDLSSFDTSQVMDMQGMFDGCKSLSDLDLSSFDTSQVASMRRMFGDCESLSDLNLSNFDMSQVTDDEDMFYNCPAKVTGL